MKKLVTLLTTILLSIGMAYSADKDLIILREGKVMTGTIITVSDDIIVYLSQHNGEEKQDRIETTKILLIKKSSGYDFVFDEDGNQNMTPTIPIEKDDVMLVLKTGIYFPIYNVSIEGNNVKYQKENKKKAPFSTSRKDEIHLIRYADGTTTTFGKSKKTKEKTVERKKTAVEIALLEKGVYVSKDIQFESGKADLKQGSMEEISQVAEYMRLYPDAIIEVCGHTDNQGSNKINIPLSRQRAQTVVGIIIEGGIASNRIFAIGKGSSAPIANNKTEAGRAQNRRVEFRIINKDASAEGVNTNDRKAEKTQKAKPTEPAKKPLLAASQETARKPLVASTPASAQLTFSPAPKLSPVEIETKVNEIDPYTLYRKGSVVEYAFEYQGEQTKYMGGPSYLRQIVQDEKVENGLLVAYISMDVLNKKQEPMKLVPNKFRQVYFPVEIDINGTYHFTHNPVKDGFIVIKRQGFGMLVPGRITDGMPLECSRIHDVAKGGVGGEVVVDSEYKDWVIEGEETITTPAGTFDCMKMKGFLAYRDGITTSKKTPSNEYVTMWLARGIGIVRYEQYKSPDRSDDPFIVYLYKADIK